MNDFRSDPTWQKDFVDALAELDNKHPVIEPDLQLAIATHKADKRCPAFQPYCQPAHQFSPDRLADVLARLTIERTVDPMIREVKFDNVKIGKVARSPWGIGWFSDAEKRIVYYRKEDAALRCYQAFREDMFSIEQEEGHQ